MALLVAATLSFSLMSLLVRMASSHFRADTLVFTRSVLQALVILPWVGSFWPAKGHLLKTVRVHFVRGAIGICAMWMIYFALGKIPLIMCSLLTMTSVLWAALLARFFLEERQGKRRLLFASIACLGVVILLAPGEDFAGYSLPLVGVSAALLGGAFMGGAQTMIRLLRRTKGTLEIVFWFGVFGAVLMLPPFLVSPEIPATLEEWGYIGGVAAFAIGGQMLMTTGYRYTSALLGSVCMLVGNFWNLGLGLLILDEVPPLHFWMGGTVMGASLLCLLLTPPRQAVSKVSTVGVQGLDGSPKA